MSLLRRNWVGRGLRTRRMTTRSASASHLRAAGPEAPPYLCAHVIFKSMPIVFFLAPAAQAAQRFPQPQFDTGHTVPQAVHPAFVELVPPWADVLILAAALAVSVWLVRTVRSRRWILAFSLVCLAWFGFVKHGCICPVGSVQNVAVATWTGGGLPWFVAAIFALPLLTALLYGRVFCAAVCPLGAMQDLFIIRPLRVPRALDAVLRLVPLAVLSVGLVYAVNGAGYVICRTDPFVGFFRRSAPLPMLLTGLAVLLLGMQAGVVVQVAGVHGEAVHQGAGDQGMMYGYACNETPELMPMPIIFAHKLTRKLAEVRKQGVIKHLGPDGKSQVTIEYKDDKPFRIEAVVIAQQHKEDISEEQLRREILEKVIKPVCGKMMDERTKIHINATGRFVIGGPEGDTGRA